MDKQEISVFLTGLIEEYLKNQGYELVELVCRYEGRDLCLRIFADRPENGITIGECMRLNREIGAILDEKDVIGERYVLEVSSPGVDRPLSTARDFGRCVNKKVKIFLKEMVSGKLEWDGIIKAVDADVVSVDVKGSILQLPVIKINMAKQIIE